MYIRKITALLFILLLTWGNFAVTGNAQRKGGASNEPGNRNDKCQQLERSLQTLIDRAVKDGLPGVTLAVSKPDCGLVQLSSGTADFKGGRKMTIQDHFRLASCSKPFIGVVIMQLVEEGKISLSDPISKYLPGEYVSNINNVNKSTIRQLMNHTSGIYDYFNDKFVNVSEKHPGKVYTLAEALKFAYGKPAVFSPPGSDYNYSNTDTILLAVIIEKVLQIPFTTALTERIFRPLKLADTYNDYADAVIEPLTHGYYFESPTEKIDYTDINQGYGLPDGGIVSNAKDLTTFLHALLREGRLLKPKTLAEMLTIDKVAVDAQEGLNIFIYANYLNIFNQLIGHDGEIAGYKSFMYYSPDQDISIVVLTNSSGIGIGKKWDKLFDNIANTVVK